MTILFYAPLETFAQPAGTGVYISNLLNALLEIDRSNRYNGLMCMMNGRQ
jgi:hypothetical protein